MVRITTIKINLLLLRLIFILALFTLLIMLFWSAFFSQSSGSIVNNISVTLLKQALGNTITIAQEPTKENNGIISAAGGLCEYLIGFDLKKPQTVFNSQIPLIAGVGNDLSIASAVEIPKFDLDEEQERARPKQSDGQVKTNEPEITPIETVTKVKGITLINETKYNIDLKSILNSPLKISQSGKPQVLIYHTHTCESYKPSPRYDYVPSDTDRTNDLRYTVVRVGDELAKNLSKEYGINVLHDRTIHDGDSYNRAYSKSLNTVQGYLKKYPSLDLIIDIHRDAGSTSGGKMRVTANVDGKPISSVMAVIGTDGRGLAHPNWRENLKLGTKFIKKANDLYPGMGRGVNLKLGRFNQYVSQNSILLEIGSNGNTLDESLESTKYIARVINEVLKEAR